MKTKYSFIVSIILAAGIILVAGTGSKLAAQKYKVGDRVEIDTNQTSFSYPDSKQVWQTGTVTEVDQRAGYRPAYKVKVGSQIYSIPIKPNPSEKSWIRGVAGGNGGDNGGGGGNNGGGQQPDNGQQGMGNFKVGDRVETDILQISTASPASMQIWKKATITAIEQRPGYRPKYGVEVDPEPGQLPKTYYVPITPNNTERVWIRPAGGGPAKTETNKLHTDENGTILADREPLDCFNFKQPAARNGQPPPVDLAKKLIPCALGENPSPKGGEGAKTVDIGEFQVGAPRRWDPTRDTGAGGTINTLVYPVRVKYNTKEFHQEQNIAVTGREQTFACSVQVGEWVCGPDQVLKEGEKRRIKVTP